MLNIAVDIPQNSFAFLGRAPRLLVASFLLGLDCYAIPQESSLFCSKSLH